MSDPVYDLEILARPEPVTAAQAVGQAFPHMIEISVVIATAGRREWLARALDALAAQDFPTDRYEILVAVDGPDPASEALLAERARTIPNLRFVVLPRRGGPAAARNAALALARGELVAFTDDDCLPAPGWLRAFRNRLAREPEVVGLIGRTVTGDAPRTPFSHYVENLDGQGHQTCNAAYRREILQRLQGFQTDYPGAYLEDTDLYLRASRLGPVRFEPAALVTHPPRELRFWQLVRRARKYEADFIFYRKHPEVYRQRHAGHGPVCSLLYFTGLKHFLRLAWDHFPRAGRKPGLYLSFLAACALERLYLLWLLPGFWWKHRRAPRSAGAGDGSPADLPPLHPAVLDRHAD